MKTGDKIIHKHHGTGVITKNASSSGLPGRNNFWVKYDRYIVPHVECEANIELVTPAPPEDCIVLTFTEAQVKELKTSVGQEYNNLDFWNRPAQNFNTLWIWTIKANDLSGSSGYGSLRHTIEMNPTLPIKHLWKK